MSGYFSDRNPALGAVQVDNYTGYVASLPVIESSLFMFANSVDLESGQASIQNIRKFEHLNLDALSAVPISRSTLNDDRIASVQGEVIPVNVQYYGSTLIIDNVYKANTKESVMSAATKLLTAWGSKLKETLLYNMLQGAGIHYKFVNGGASPSKANLKDLVLAKSQLDKNRARRVVMSMVKASEQIGTSPIGQSFTGHVSIGGRSAWELAIENSVDIVRPYEVPYVSEYLYQNIFYVKKADTCLYSSTEIVDNENDRVMILHGDEAYLVVGKSPIGMAMIFDPECVVSYGLFSRVSYRMPHGQAVIRNERIVNCKFTDN